MCQETTISQTSRNQGSQIRSITFVPFDEDPLGQNRRGPKRHLGSSQSQNIRIYFSLNKVEIYMHVVKVFKRYIYIKLVYSFEITKENKEKERKKGIAI